jgi:hypothetical protein
MKTNLYYDARSDKHKKGEGVETHGCAVVLDRRS